jgi:hypothetical protein
VRVSIQHVALRDIVPNRYRNIDRYRISEVKIAQLLESYEISGFWDGSIQARPHPTKSGKYEIAFGHHRIEAAKRAKSIETVGLVIAPRSDADMLRMMALENSEEFKGDSLVTLETVGATIEAFGRGEIELDQIAPDTNKAHIHALPGGKAYTLSTVARFLGWIKPSDQQATNACRQAFDGYHDQIGDVLATLPETQRGPQEASTVLRAARSARVVARRAHQPKQEVEAAARRAAKEAVKQIRDGKVASKVKDEATKIGRKAAKVERSPVEISQFVRQRMDGLKTRVLNFTSEIEAVLSEVWPYHDQLDEPAQHVVVDVLRFSKDRTREACEEWIARFSARPIRNVTPQRKRLKG